MGVKKFQAFYHKDFNKKNDRQNFTRVIKYFTVATAFVFYCDAKHLDILWGSSHVRYYLFIWSL